MARKLVKYMYAKFIFQEVNKIISDCCEGCQHDYLSQREHECMYYATLAGRREVINRHFAKAAERVSLDAVERAIQIVAESCDIRVDFGLIDLDELLQLLCYRWGEDPEACFDALEDNITVYGMILCNEVIDSMTSTKDSSDC